MIEEANKAVTRRWVEEGLNQRNFAVLDECIGDVNFREFLKTGMLETWPDVQITIEELIADGDMVAYRNTHRATMHGPWAGYPGSGQPVEYQILGMDRIVDGKLVQHWSRGDNLDVLQQAGVIPRPG